MPDLLSLLVYSITTFFVSTFSGQVQGGRKVRTGDFALARAKSPKSCIFPLLSRFFSGERRGQGDERGFKKALF
jgi:hypothetical protein